MATGRIKTYDAEGKFGFIAPDSGDKDLYVAADQLEGTPSPGALVSFEVQETEGKDRHVALNVKVESEAPRFNPVGRTMAAPPTWSELEERDRQARAARRRRR